MAPINVDLILQDCTFKRIFSAHFLALHSAVKLSFRKYNQGESIEILWFQNQKRIPRNKKNSSTTIYHLPLYSVYPIRFQRGLELQLLRTELLTRDPLSNTALFLEYILTTFHSSLQQEIHNA